MLVTVNNRSYEAYDYGEYRGMHKVGFGDIINQYLVKQIFEKMHYNPSECTVWLHPNIPSDNENIYALIGDKEHFDKFCDIYTEDDFIPWWDRSFYAKEYKITSGPAGGKTCTLIHNKAGFRIGGIQPTNYEFGQGGLAGTYYLVQREYKDFEISAEHTLHDAFKFITKGINPKAQIDWSKVSKPFSEK